MPGPVARRGRAQLLEHSPDRLSYCGKVSPDGGHRGQEFSSPPGTERWKLEDKDAAWDLSLSAATTQPRLLAQIIPSVGYKTAMVGLGFY